MSQNVKTKANNYARLTDLFKFARKYYAPMMLSIVLLIGSAVLSILTPRYVQTLTNLISPAELVVGPNGMVEVKMDLFIQNAITLLCFIIASFILSMVSGMIFNVAVKKLSRDIRSSCYSRRCHHRDVHLRVAYGACRPHLTPNHLDRHLRHLPLCYSIILQEPKPLG